MTYAHQWRPRELRRPGLCRKHYNRRWYKANPRAKKRVKKPTCQELDCRRSAIYRFTWPYPILREEIHCRDHAEVLLGSFIQGITVEDI